VYVSGSVDPADVVTTTETGPAVSRAGVTNVNVVPPAPTVTAVAGMVTPPMVTVVAPGTKLLPVTVTVCPPAVGPLGGASERAVGAGSAGRSQEACASVMVPVVVATPATTALTVRTRAVEAAVSVVMVLVSKSSVAVAETPGRPSATTIGVLASTVTVVPATTTVAGRPTVAVVAAVRSVGQTASALSDEAVSRALPPVRPGTSTTAFVIDVVPRDSVAVEIAGEVTAEPDTRVTTPRAPIVAPTLAVVEVASGGALTDASEVSTGMVPPPTDGVTFIRTRELTEQRQQGGA